MSTHLRIVVNYLPTLDYLFAFQTLLDAFAALGTHDDVSTRPELQVSLSFLAEGTEGVGGGRPSGRYLTFLHPGMLGM